MAQSEFLSRMSHELRTPLASILGFAELLRNKVACVDKKSEDTFIETIIRNSKHLLGLVTSLMEKLGGGTMRIFGLMEIRHRIYESVH